MNWFIFFVIIVAYYDLNSNIKKILNNQNKNNKKDFSILKNLINKEIQIEFDNENIGPSKKGVLKEFNDVWIVLQEENKKNTELNYYKLINVQSISEIK